MNSFFNSTEMKSSIEKHNRWIEESVSYRLVCSSIHKYPYALLFSIITVNAALMGIVVIFNEPINEIYNLKTAPVWVVAPFVLALIMRISGVLMDLMNKRMFDHTRQKDMTYQPID